MRIVLVCAHDAFARRPSLPQNMMVSSNTIRFHPPLHNKLFCYSPTTTAWYRFIDFSLPSPSQRHHGYSHAPLPLSLLARHQSSMRFLWVCVPTRRFPDFIHWNPYLLGECGESPIRPLGASPPSGGRHVSQSPQALCLQRRGRKARRLLPGSYKGRVRRLSKDNARSSR